MLKLQVKYSAVQTNNFSIKRFCFPSLHNGGALCLFARSYLANEKEINHQTSYEGYTRTFHLKGKFEKKASRVQMKDLTQCSFNTKFDV